MHSRCSMVFLVFAAIMGMSQQAHAWTRATVSHANAHVTVHANATLHVMLRLKVEVHAGWVREMQLDGLGDGVELDVHDPPRFISHKGYVLFPDAEVTGKSSVRFSFSRKSAPQRGAHQVVLSYRVKGDVQWTQGKSYARVAWTMPAWKTGLHAPTIDMVAPPGSKPVESQDAPAGAGVEVIEEPGQTVLAWRCDYLPRTTPWRVELDIPHLTVPVTPPRTRSQPQGFAPLAPQPTPKLAWHVLVIAILALSKRRWVELQIGQKALLVPAPWSAILATSIAVVAIAQWVHGAGPFCAGSLVFLGIHRSAHGVTANAAHLPKRRKMRGIEAVAGLFLDGSTVLGVLTWVTLATVMVATGHAVVAALPLLLFYTGTQHHLPATRAQTEALLCRFASELRVPIDTTSLSFALDRARPVPRLHVYGPYRSGLQSMSFVVALASTGFFRRRQIMLRVCVRLHSEAHMQIRHHKSFAPVHCAPRDYAIWFVRWNSQSARLLMSLMLRETRCHKPWQRRASAIDGLYTPRPQPNTAP